MAQPNDRPEHDEYGAIWCGVHGRYECTGQRSKGRGKCHQARMIGLNTCQHHQGRGGPARHLAALQEREYPLRVQEIDIHPAEALLWRVRYLTALLRSIDHEVAELRRQEIGWGLERETVEVAEGHGRAITRTMGAKLSWWIIYQEKIDKALQSACVAALQAAAEDRLVRMAQAQGAKAFAAYQAGLAKLQLTDAQWDLAREGMPQVLQELLG